MSNELSRALQLLSPKKDTVFFYSFLPKIITNYFDDNLGQDKDEKIKSSTVNEYVLTGSMDTAALDPYRQGVELTRLKHFDAGASVKIHAGEPGHVLRKNLYGTDRNFLKQNYYQDLDYFDPIEYIKSDQVLVTYPIITHDSDETENYNFNGVIEPLTIRAVAALFSIDVPFEAHAVKGMMMDGNSDITTSNSRILTVDDKTTNHKITPWLDLIDMIGTVKKIPTMAFFNDDKTYINPFNDGSIKVQLSTNMSSEMSHALLQMNPMTEDYVPNGKISATSGWTYDDVTLKGTDSIAFGGFGY
jgi:hypothetical protein